ncbi:L,D-transpeptidase family protein [Mucilaginibacter sp. Mucisp86]|uniref:L,D-transpeptidase family protein n=1 Tax=Mucilaginibacter sp. Mucisp86 TaxID=3243060 RepID=UPI0039B5D67E
MKKLILVMFIVELFFSIDGFAQDNNPALVSAVRHQLNSPALLQVLHYPQTATRFYRQNNYRAVWINPESHSNTGNAMLLIDCVMQYGLSHNDFHPKDLQFDVLRDILDNPNTVGDSLKAKFDVLLTDAIITMMNHLHYGKLNPDYGSARIDYGMDIPFAAETKLKNVIDSPDFKDAILSVQPRAKIYVVLREMLYVIRGQAPDDCYGEPGSDVMKIAANMERIRWAEIDDKQEFIQINVPTYTLKLHLPDTTMLFKVIVGAPETPSPTLQSQVTYLTTYPNWLIPNQIFTHHILQNALADSLFLVRNQISIYNMDGELTDITNAQLKLILKSPGGYYAKQAPGCDKTLGAMVFHFQNSYNIYLNQTDDPKLFILDKRDVSNGCIWIDKAAELGALLLKYDGLGQAAQMYRSLKKAKTQNFILNKSVPLKITYLTCEVRNGELIRFEDIYNLDESLEMAIYGKNTHNISVK